ncbi:unnamed protein product [Oreochromis niloticus]|nr:unnamed protein product [Mustela putorius furo]
MALDSPLTPAVQGVQTAAVAKSPQEVFGYLGENITLPSGVDPSWSLIRIQWSIFTNTTWIATYCNGMSNTERFPQYTGRLTLNTISGDLTIHNLKESDTIEYTVEVINSEGEDKVNKIKLTAKQKLQQPSIQTVTSTSVESGCLMVVTCSSLDEGVNLSWSVEPVSVLTINKSHPSDSSAQLFAFVSTKDFASFTCISSRDTESVSSKPVTPKCDSKICALSDSSTPRPASVSSSSPAGLDVRMTHILLCMSGLFLLSAVICGNAEELGVKATVTADRLTIPTGGSVTLTCVAQHFADLEYYWIRETSSENKSLISTGAVISISEGGNYTCRGWRRDTNSLLTESDSVTIQETVSNRTDVKLQHSWSQIFTGETITLRCEIQGGEGKVWKYEWTAPNTNSPPTSSEYRISRVSVSHSGDYRCRGSSDYLLTGWSDAFRLTVSSASKPRATLTAHSSVIPAGGSVTLSCSVEGSAGWKFDWFRRDSVSSKAQLMRGNEANRVISVSQGGLYHCRGGRGDPVYYTEDSSDVTVVETFPSKPTVTLQPSWTQIYSGETVTVRCEIQGGEGAQWTYEWRAAKLNTPPTSNEHRIITATESDSGGYSCRGRRDYFFSEWSDIITLTVSSSKPRATLTAHSSIIPAGGSVTLSCSVEGSAGWKFDWFRRDSQFSGGQKIGAGTSEHTISISEGGNYYCRGGRGDPVFSTEDSAPVTIQKQVLAAVKLQHSWSQIFTGETITLRCEIQGGEGKVWKYEWTAPNTNSPPTSSEYRISRVSVSHSGDYRCRGSSDYLLTGWSDAFRLTVSSASKPRATLTAQSSVIPAGGSVTLSCSVEGSAGWKFDWFRRDSVSSKAQLMRGNEANRVISVSQGGLYHCRGGRGDPVYYTEDSSDVTVTETLPSKPTVTLQPSWTQIYSGETVTVRCEIQGGEGAQWTYEWRAAKLNTPPTSNEHRIIRATESDSGGYSCRGRRDYFFTEWSDIITLTVSYKPKAKLRADNTAVPVGGSVTLTCSVNPSSSSGWKYYWYRDEKSSEALTTQDAVFHSNGQISVSQEGLYRCRGGRGNPVYYTEDSQSVRIGKTVTASNRPVVTLYPNWSEIYRGETITVRCEIHGGDTEWDYEWETNSRIKAPNQNEYRIRSASSSNSGNYRCKGRMKSSQHKTTEWSDSVTLTVSDNKPRPVLTVSPSWLSPGASVTLNCEVEHPSAGWSFYWYKAVPDLSEKSSSYELLPDGSGTAQDSYIIHGQTHTAGYVCRAGRGDPEYHTDHSQPKFVWSADVHSAASLTVSPDRVQHFTSDSVSLTCEGNFTEWRVRKFSEDGRLYSDCRRMTGSTCNINTSESDTAVYWCESGSGEFSSAVNITVQNDGNGPILVSPVHPVTEGASVSLSCSLRTQKILSNVFFYHNDKLIQNDTRGELKISAVSKSDEGFYKCQYSGRESAQSWMSVKGADKPPDVIYSNIELENFGNKWKHHKPEQSAVYTNVKTGAAGQ